MTQTLQQQAAKVRQLKQEVEHYKACYDDANFTFKHAQQALFDRMEAEDTKSMRTGGILYTSAETVYGQVQDEAAFAAWCEANDAEDYFEAKPRKKLINEFVRERLDAGLPLPPGLGFYTQQYVSQRGDGSVSESR